MIFVREFYCFQNYQPCFARHLESKVVSFTRLMNFKRSILIDLSQYLEIEVADGATRKVQDVAQKENLN